jgi:predicted acylesterase/phospholipase RssA
MNDKDIMNDKDTIDTLVISGASTKIISFIGIFRALYEKHILSPDLNNIKHISCVSIGYFYSILLSLRISERFCYECILKTDFMNLLDLDSISIDSLIQDMGLIDHSKIARPIEIILKDILKKDNVTLKELYNKTQIKISVKCVNVTKSETYFINHETDPDLEVLHLLLMTTAIPLFFKPVLYNENYYIDGGLSGNLPIEGIDVKKDNYLGIYISGNKAIDFKKESVPILAFLNNMLTVSSTKLDLYLKRSIVLIMDEDSTQFEFTNQEKQKMIDNAYKNTILQIKDKFNID